MSILSIFFQFRRLDLVLLPESLRKKKMHIFLLINNILSMLLQRFSPKVKHILPE